MRTRSFVARRRKATRVREYAQKISIMYNVRCSEHGYSLNLVTMAFKILAALVLVSLVVADDDLQDFEFSKDAEEIMIAQESRHYQTFVKPPIRIVKPHGVTNSHRPQYNLDSFEDVEETHETTTRRNLKNYKSSHKLRSKEGLIRDAVLRALERKDHVGKFAQILPIIRAMSGNQRVALASLVASQVSTPPGRQPLNLSQVRSMFGNANATSDLMLPILLDMANLIRKAVRSGKEPREVREPLTLPQAQLLRRSFTEDTDSDTLLDDEPFDYSTTTKATETQRYRRIPQRRYSPKVKTDTNDTKINEVKKSKEEAVNVTKTTSTTELPRSSTVRNKNATENSTVDLMADATNQTLAQDLPVAEKLRALNRFIDRKGNLIRRGTFPPKPPARRATAESTISPVRIRRPAPARKLPVITTSEQAKCELFTNSLCLHSEDYPTDAIIQSIRRNKAAAGALLADFRDPGEGALDGVTADQEAKYTAEHYLVSNRRGDTANRDFASAGEAGFMCPSTVKYARPQRARATSGQWKYIVNTGEHTQTLRLEKCLKPKESCTYLTDNFKSKCVQVYNYHRLLTWDQQNGLHMDIFKVPTCCSCHIEGYSVSFPPLGHRIHETSGENMPVEELSSEQGNHAFENVQSSIQRPTVSKNPPFTYNKPLESFSPFSDNHNLITGNLIRRGTFPPKPPARRATAESTISPVRIRRPAPARKLPVITTSEQAKCELFTNSLCLHSEDYPTDAIIQSIRRNKAAAGALLADFRDPGEGALDGVTADQEAKYTAEHYLVSNRRGDTANRDFASAGEAGFMCPSTVKYARPQRARATSGQWKYIVNTGEHTQTLRLEKCLKPKESCTYLTDNFKSKCVQVYNYHRLLTWDQQNGLHMDIFKVPTCCSCHIEGYSVSFPPLGHRIHETSGENMPVEELSSEQGNHAFENVQSSIQRPTVSKNPPFTYNKPLESFSPFSDNHNLITGTSFTNAKINDDELNSNLPIPTIPIIPLVLPSSPTDSYGNTYFPDSFNQATSIRNVKRPPISRNPVSTFDPVTLPSYLEPPTPSAPSSFSFSNDIPNKFKNTFKRGAGRPNRRPIRKKISSAPDDLSSSGTTALESFTGSNLETVENFSEDEEDESANQKTIPSRQGHPTIAPKLHAATSEKAPTFNQQEHTKSAKDNVSNGKRVNYNYHPIIDFFGEEERDQNESIDREDVEVAYVPSSESEWKPMNHPPNRHSQNNNLVERRKH